jgi:tetratricopeptide (TPR) repeat protein
LLRNALEIDPTSADAQFNLGTALFNLEQYADAREPLQMAVSLNPAESAPALSLLGEAQLKLGDIREALRAFRKSLETTPDQPKAAELREKIRKLEETAARPIGG